MRRATLLALLLGALLVIAPFTHVRAEEAEEDDSEDADEDDADVVVLGMDNFEDTVGKSKFALVEFYAPWCGHCKKLKPEYAAAATELKAYDPTIIIGKVDATEHDKLGSQFGVEGYPTIKWFVDGEVASDYNGPRDAEGIVRWVKKKTGPAAATVASKAELEALEEGEELLVLGYFKDLKGTEHAEFTKAAQKNDDGVFIQTTSADVAKAAGLTKAPGVAVIANFKGEARASVPLKDKVTEEAVTELLQSEKLPLVIPFNDQNGQKIFGSGINTQALLVASADDLAGDIGKAFKAAAANFKGKVLFVSVDLDGESKDPVVNFFGLAGQPGPLLVGFELQKSRKFRMPGDITEEAITDFVTSLVEGTAQPEFKSAPIPEEPLEGGVAVIVGKNFEEVVKDDTKDVLLEVYAPWCGHCKKLEPIYKKLAKRFKKIDSVVIAKMDGTENEHPDIEVKGFPTIIFFPAGGEPSMVYEGGRTLKDMTKFIKKNAHTSFDLPKKKGAAADDDEEEPAEEEESAHQEL